MAMLLSFLPATAWAVNEADDTVELLSADEAAVVQVSSPEIEFVRASEPLRQEGRYLLMSDAYGHIMSFDATAAPEVASGEQHGTSYTGSVMLDADGDSVNTYYMDGDTVILDNSDRHFVLWNLRQYKEATGGTVRPNGALLATSGNSTFGGTAQYSGVELQKRTNYHDSYWYSHYFQDSEVACSDFQLRFFCFKSDSTAFKNHYRNSLQTTNNDVYGDQSGSRVKFILDSLGDGTYLLYFKESDTDYRVVTCDGSGKWDVIRYQGSNAVSSMKADMDKLRLRLNEYTETEGHKCVAFSGQLKYQVSRNTAVDTILNQISDGITVFDPTRQNQHIPYNGSEVTLTNIGGTQYAVDTKAGYYWLDAKAVNTAAAGEYPVLIKYRNDDGTDTTVGQVAVIVGSGYAVIEGSAKHGTVMKNAGVSAVVNVISGDETAPATFTLNGETIVITVGMLSDVNGNRLDTSVPGEYKGLTLTYKGMTICGDFTLTVADSDHALDYPEYDLPGSVEVYKGSSTTEADFSGTGVANIELSAAAKPVQKGVDLIFIVDLSGSMRYHVNNSQYACGPKYMPNGELNTKTVDKYTTQKEQLTYVYKDEWWQYTRLAAMENALADMVNTLSDSNADVQIAIADFGDLDHYEFEDAKLDDIIGNPLGAKPYWDADLNDTGSLSYEFSNHVNFILGRDDTSYTGTGAFMSQPYWVDQTKHNDDFKDKHGNTYTGKLNSKIFTGNGTLSGDAFMDVKELQPKLEDLKENLKKQNGKRLGTNYDVGLETAYRLAYAREQHNIAAGEERDIVCIFMSDGAAMQFNYLSGRSQTEAWSQCIIGETDEILDPQNVADKYVITSDPYDTSVNQNPYLQAMLKDLLGILKEGNLIIPTKSEVKSTYPKLEEYLYSGTDFFQAMKAIGVDCDWELLWQIAYELYTHHSARTVALADGSIIQRNGQKRHR